MRKSLTVLFLVLMTQTTVHAQASNFHCTNAAAEQVMLGNYNPALYAATTVLSHPDTLAAGILARVNPDSLKAYTIALAAFRNRNSGADTMSATQGYGAARRWVYHKFQQFSSANENRLLPAFLKFDQNICSIGQHSDVVAVLPGTDTTDTRVVLVEGHMDSRCEGLCDTACIARGVEDNASGTALVMELARVMSRYSYHHSLVFVITTAEEQGLYGAEAFADYAFNNNMGILCVQNNDVVGGIACGITSSAPGCPGIGDIDSTHLRLFSAGSFNSPHKQYSRFVKLEYQEEMKALAPVKTDIMIMTAEDRTGRGGDHIPFRQHGYTAMRFTAANESGDANVVPGYTDRQHSYRDTLGIDTNGDMVIDSFFVDFNYLARNTVINGNALAMAAIGPVTPNFNVTAAGVDSIRVDITSATGYDVYRVAVRSNTHDWDTVFYMNDTIGIFKLNPATTHYISVASVLPNGVESLFSGEKLVHVSVGVSETKAPEKDFMLLSNKPNPFDESTTISVMVGRERSYKSAYIVVTDLGGKEIQRLPLALKAGVNEVMYTHGYHATGTFLYSLVVDGVSLQTGKMIFAN